MACTCEAIITGRWRPPVAGVTPRAMLRHLLSLVTALDEALVGSPSFPAGCRGPNRHRTGHVGSADALVRYRPQALAWHLLRGKRPRAY